MKEKCVMGKSRRREGGRWEEEVEIGKVLGLENEEQKWKEMEGIEGYKKQRRMDVSREEDPWWENSPWKPRAVQEAVGGKR